MRLERLGSELRVELTSEKPRMIGELNNLYKLAVGRSARKDKAVFGETIFVCGIELKAMPMAFEDHITSVNSLGQRTRSELAWICPESAWFHPGSRHPGDLAV